MNITDIRSLVGLHKTTERRTALNLEITERMNYQTQYAH